MVTASRAVPRPRGTIRRRSRRIEDHCAGKRPSAETRIDIAIAGATVGHRLAGMERTVIDRRRLSWTGLIPVWTTSSSP
ncbi:hypothetical protein QR64_20130 [Rhodococcus sp. Chr-9]|nr:hypothetical protein QR64_20130 [Rhodococcus sp. Chr-9]